MEQQYIELQDLITRDLSIGYYQVQFKNNATNVVYIDNYVTPPIMLVMEKQFGEYTCKLLSHLNSEEQIKKNVLNTMSWQITKGTKHVAKIDCLFIIDDFLEDNVEGEYQVWENYKKIDLIYSSFEMPTVNKLYELLLLHIGRYE